MRIFNHIGAFSALIVIVLIGASCASRQIREHLADIESYIDSRPDSALVAIRQIDTTALRGRAAKAKYSLLHAIALDKNYIDTADTRIVQPAVDWYDHHGSPEERLKAYYYQGREFYNDKQYNKAAVSYTIALESIGESKDFKQNAMLYSAMADALIFTRDFVAASAYLDKAISGFAECGRKDWEMVERYRKAQNLVNLKEWEKAEEIFRELLNDDSVPIGLRARIEADFAMALVTGPNKDNHSAVELFTDAARINNGKLQDNNQYGAFAYSLYCAGERERSDSLMHSLQSRAGSEDLYFKYWSHSIMIEKNEYKSAYKTLKRAKESADSIIETQYKMSAANAQRAFLENANLEARLRSQQQKSTILLVILAAMVLALSALFVFKRITDRYVKEKESIATILNSLEERMKEMKKDNNTSKFKYLSELYSVYTLVDNKESESSLRKSFFLLKNKVGDLGDNEASQKRFEELLNKESDNIMNRFRSGFPDLSEKEYRMAGYLFVGFDNSIIGLLLKISPSNVRVMKSRLKSKVESSEAVDKNVFKLYFNT